MTTENNLLEEYEDELSAKPGNSLTIPLFCMLAFILMLLFNTFIDTTNYSIKAEGVNPGMIAPLLLLSAGFLLLLFRVRFGWFLCTFLFSIITTSSGIIFISALFNLHILPYTYALSFRLFLNLLLLLSVMVSLFLKGVKTRLRISNRQGIITVLAGVLLSIFFLYLNTRDFSK